MQSLRKFDENERREILKFFSEVYGIPPKIFQDYELLARGKNVWMVSSSHLNKVFEMKPEFVGTMILRRGIKFWKPTTAFVTLFGHLATKNFIEVSKEEALEFLKGGSIEKRENLTYPHVIIRYRGRALGCGYLGKRKILSEIPSKLREIPRIL